jgi:hypothetical protein
LRLLPDAEFPHLRRFTGQASTPEAEQVWEEATATIDPEQRYSQARTVELPRGGTYAELLLAEVHTAIRSRLNERAAVVPKRRGRTPAKGPQE